MKNIKRVFYYIDLWGFRLTFFKILGRLRFFFIFPPFFRQNILVIGCGQFSFSTLMPNILRFNLFSPVRYAYDVNQKNLLTFCKTFACKSLTSIDSINNKDIKLAYVCSNHSSHFSYTCYLLQKDIDVYCEKPLTTSLDQVYHLAKIINKSKSKFKNENLKFSTKLKK